MPQCRTARVHDGLYYWTVKGHRSVVTRGHNILVMEAMLVEKHVMFLEMGRVSIDMCRES
jgi:hypothetical protein